MIDIPSGSGLHDYVRLSKKHGRKPPRCSRRWRHIVDRWVRVINQSKSEYVITERTLGTRQ